MASPILPVSQLMNSATFAEAWPVWLRGKFQEIGTKTQKCYREYFKQLDRFFSTLRLDEITYQHIVDYRESRKESAGPGLINHEVNALGQLLERAGLWDPIRRCYKQLKVPKSTIGQRPTDEELIHLFQCAQKKARWRLAYLASVVSIQTAAGPEEVLGIKLGHINWADPPILHIHGTKTEFRPRDIPMTEDCCIALRELELLARAKGASDPDHFLFPHLGNP